MHFLSALLTLSSGVSREYHYVQLLKTWSEAQSYCRENFVDLATIETAQDWERVKTIMKSADRLAWTGLYDDINSWRWSIDNTYLYSARNSEFGEWFVFAKPGKQHCVEIFGSTLYEHSCTILQNSVCYDHSSIIQSHTLNDHITH